MAGASPFAGLVIVTFVSACGSTARNAEPAPHGALAGPAPAEAEPAPAESPAPAVVDEAACEKDLDNVLAGGRAIAAATVERVGALAGRCRPVLDEPISNLAREWHDMVLGAKAAGKAPAVATLEPTIELYRLLPAADGGLRAAQDRYTLGQLLWKRAELGDGSGWDGVAMAFHEAAEASSLDEKYRKQAIDACVLAWDKAVVWDERESRRAAGKAPSSGPSDGDRKRLAAYDLYLRLEGHGAERAPAIEFLRARTYWGAGDLERALPHLEHLVESHARHEVGARAAELLLDTLVRTKRHELLGNWVKKMRGNKELTRDKRLLETLERLEWQLEMKAAADLHAAGDFRGCGARHRSIYEAHKKHPDAFDALFNAGVCYEQGGAVDEARSAFRELVRRAPKSKLAEMARERLKGLGSR